MRRVSPPEANDLHDAETRRSWRWLLISSALVAVLIAGWMAADRISRGKLERARAAFAAHGLPSTLADIVPPAVPDEENAASLLDEMAAVLRSRRGADANDRIQSIMATRATSPDGLSRLPEARRVELRHLLGTPEIEAVLKLARAAARRRAYVPALDYTSGLAMAVPPVSCFRNAACLLAVNAESAANDPSVLSDSWDDLDRCHRLGRQAGEVPMLISLLTEVAIAGITGQAELVVLADAGPPPDIDRALADRLAALPRDDAILARAIDAERVVMLEWLYDRYVMKGDDWIADLNAWSGSGFTRAVRSALSPFATPLARPLLSADLRHAYEVHFQAALAARAPAGESAVAWADCERLAQTIKTPLSATIMPALAGVAATHAVFRTRQRLMIVLFAAVKHRRDTGAWPDSTNALGLPGDVATDPCSGKPIVVREHDGVLLVYAPGFDRDDDSGREAAKPGETGADGDIAIRVRPAGVSPTPPRVNAP